MEFLYLSRQDREALIEIFESEDENLKGIVRRKLADHILKSLIFCNIPTCEVNNILSHARLYKNHIKQAKARKEFRKQILTKNGRICQLCGSTDKILTVHHIQTIEDYPELRFEASNVAVLCERCHKLVHNSEYRNRVEYLFKHTNFNCDELSTEFPYKPELEIMVGK
jgi:5-methylcytosine-specific restriction endonuclease McrA